MKIESVCIEHHARRWALEGITQHSLEVTGVAGDHLTQAPLRYLATHALSGEDHGCLKGKYFWGTFWVSHLYGKTKEALAAMLQQAAQDIQQVSVHRIIITATSQTVREYLEALGFFPVYAPRLYPQTAHMNLKDYRYVFDLSCSALLVSEHATQTYTITFEALRSNQFANTECLPCSEKQGWIAKSTEDVLLGYIELGTYQHQAHIRLLYTDPSYRQQGVARLLVNAAHQYAILQKCTLFTVETLSYQASTFYEKQGFCKVLMLEGLRSMCVATPHTIPKISDPLSFIFLTRILSVPHSKSN